MKLNTMCKMNRAFIKARDHVSCVTTHSLHNIQSSSSGQNSIITTEVATNPLLLQNCN